MDRITEAVIVCKRVTIEKGIEFFPIGVIHEDDSEKDEGARLQYCRIRQRYSNNEKFYAIGKKNFDDEDMKEHIFSLIEKGIESILYTYI